MAFTILQDVLELARKRYGGLDARLDETAAMKRWQDAVGAKIAKHARAISVRDGVMFVEVDHPVWKSELQHRKSQILGILNVDSKQVVADLFLIDPIRPTLRSRFASRKNHEQS